MSSDEKDPFATLGLSRFEVAGLGSLLRILSLVRADEAGARPSAFTENVAAWEAATGANCSGPQAMLDELADRIDGSWTKDRTYVASEKMAPPAAITSPSRRAAPRPPPKKAPPKPKAAKPAAPKPAASSDEDYDDDADSLEELFGESVAKELVVETGNKKGKSPSKPRKVADEEDYIPDDDVDDDDFSAAEEDEDSGWDTDDLAEEEVSKDDFIISDDTLGRSRRRKATKRKAKTQGGAKAPARRAGSRAAAGTGAPNAATVSPGAPRARPSRPVVVQTRPSAANRAKSKTSVLASMQARMKKLGARR